MNKILQIFVLVTLAVFSFDAFGECCTRVAVIDGQKIIENSSAYKSISTQVEKEAGFYQSRASDLEKNLHQKHKSLEKQKSVLKAEEYNQKLRDLEEEAQKAQEFLYTEKIALDKSYTGAMKKLEEKITEIVSKEAKDKFEIVMTKTNTLYYEKSLDITDSIVTQLNQSIKDIKVDFNRDQKKK